MLLDALPARRSPRPGSSTADGEPVRHRSSARRRALTTTASLLTCLALTAPTAPAQAADSRILIGAVGLSGEVDALERSIGAPLSVHAYSTMDGSVPNARFINMRTEASWPAVASAQPGSAIYDHIVRWARAIKGRPGPVLFAFHHEPEASTSAGMGSSADYVNAYRKVVDIFRAQGVANVEYVWQMTSWAFTTSSSDRRYAAKWYPGDSYVTHVGVDPYNWHDCGPGDGTWKQLSTVMADSLAFSRQKGKKLVVAEFASDADPRRAAWLRNANDYIVANRASIRGVFYFHFKPRPGCSWKLMNGADLDAYGDMARNTGVFNGA